MCLGSYWLFVQINLVILIGTWLLSPEYDSSVAFLTSTVENFKLTKKQWTEIRFDFNSHCSQLYMSVLTFTGIKAVDIERILGNTQIA